MQTVCTNCIHHEEIRDSRNIDVWYQHFCKASSREEGVDPVSGKKCFVGKNDFGTIIYTDQQWNYCRDVNTGNCEKFKSSYIQ
jgi:hypothetical protein